MTCMHVYVMSPSLVRLPLQWHHNGHNSVSNHQPRDCLLNRLFRRRSKKAPKLRVTGLCAGNSPGTGEFPAQMASNAENVSIWWRHHASHYTSMCWSAVHEIIGTKLNTLRPRQNGRHFPDNIFKCIFLNESVWILLKFSLKFVP